MKEMLVSSSPWLQSNIWGTPRSINPHIPAIGSGHPFSENIIPPLFGKFEHSNYPARNEGQFQGESISRSSLQTFALNSSNLGNLNCLNL